MCVCFVCVVCDVCVCEFLLDDLAKFLVLFSLKNLFSKIATDIAHTHFSGVLGFLKM